MPKYLIQSSYTAEGAKGLLKDGGTKRRQAAEATLKSVGARLEAFYFALGDKDTVLIVDAPDHASVAALSIAINATGTVATKTTALLTPEEIDQAVKKNVAYTAPGR